MRTNSKSLRATVFAVVGFASLSALSACEERPYAVPVRQAYTPSHNTVLAGAPTYIAPPAAPAYAPPPPAYVSPPVEETATVTTTTEYTSAPAYTPAPAYAPPPMQTYRPAPAYDTGGPMIVAMAPIPNPTGPTRSYGYAPRHMHRTYAVAAPVYAPTDHTPPVRRTYVAKPKPVYAPKPAYVAAAPMPMKPMAPAVPRTYAQATPAPKAPMAKSVTTVEKKVTTTTKTIVADSKVLGAKTKMAAADAATAAKLDAAKAAAATKTAAAAAMAKLNGTTKPATAGTTMAATPAGDRTTKLAALQAALTDAISKSAVLTTPARFTANQPADVSLTLPADFAETMRKAADKQTLSDAAASVNMTSVLAGDGFSVTPDDTQSQPLTVGQPTEFHWTVTAQPGAKGPLHADVGADLLGAGSDTLSLGTVQKGAGMQMKMTPRMLGAGILALIVILVLGWLARGRNTPTRGAAARRAGRRARGAGFDRPLDMAGEPGSNH